MTLFSIAVCTRNRSAAAVALVRLLRRTWPAIPVCVVDSASSEPHAAALQGLVGDGVLVVREDIAGLARARNRALREATTAYVAFLDDDVLPGICWGDAIARALGDGQPGVLTGPVLPDPESWAVGIPADDVRLPARASGPLPPDGSCPGANLVLDREHALSVGGFDERFGHGGAFGVLGEETELIRRMLRAGASARVEFQMWVVHRDVQAVDWGWRWRRGLAAGATLRLLAARDAAMWKLPFRGSLMIARSAADGVGAGLTHFRRICIDRLSFAFGWYRRPPNKDRANGP